MTKQKALYSKNKGLDDNFYKELILKSIRDNKSMTRQEIVDLLWNKLPEALTEQQKKYKITNLLSSLRLAGKIKVAKGKEWVLS